jgi:hypothetical protein
MGKVISIAEKLKAVKVPGLAACISLVNGLAGALQAGINGNLEACASELLKVGKAALSIAKASGRLAGRVAGRSLPGVSLVVGFAGGLSAKEKAEQARRSGQATAAALWEIKSSCEGAITVMSALQLLTAPTATLPAGLEAGILALSLVSELVAEAAEEAGSGSAARRSAPGLGERAFAPVDNTRVVRSPVGQSTAS